jgi:hypothetical protein
MDNKTTVIEIEKKVAGKTPEYVKRAQKAYYDRNKNSQEFKDKKNRKAKEWRDANRDKYNESQRVRRQLKKANEKLEKPTG